MRVHANTLSKGGLSASLNGLAGRARAPVAFLFALPFICSVRHSYYHSADVNGSSYHRRLGDWGHLRDYSGKHSAQALHCFGRWRFTEESRHLHVPTPNVPADRSCKGIAPISAPVSLCMHLPLAPPGGLTSISDCKALKRYYSTEDFRPQEGTQKHVDKKVCVKMEAQSDMQQDSPPIETSTPSRNSHRTQREIELALEVINDQLAVALPLDKPALELTAQSLTQRLLEMKKQEQQGFDISMERRQTTREYSQSLPAVLVGDGTQKYVLIRIPKQDDMVGDVYLVRGDPKAEYHYQTAIDTIKDLESRDIMVGELTGRAWGN